MLKIETKCVMSVVTREEVDQIQLITMYSNIIGMFIVGGTLRSQLHGPVFIFFHWAFPATRRAVLCLSSARNLRIFVRTKVDSRKLLVYFQNKWDYDDSKACATLITTKFTCVSLILI